MAIDLTLSTIFEKAFGYTSRAFDPTITPVQGDSIKDIGRVELGATGARYYDADANGTEYYLPVKISYPQDTVVDGRPAGKLVDWWLPYPVISVTSKKTIVETPLTERRGFVHEYINIDSYEINIKGFIIGNTNEFPESDVAMLRELYEVNAPVFISNPITDIFLLRPDRSGSDQVIIKELRFPEVKGIKNVRPYELVMASDEPFNLIDIS